MNKGRSKEKAKKEGSKVPIGIEKAWELTHEQITLEKKLGEGAFGEVHAGKLKMNKRVVDVAVKVSKSEGDKEKLKELMREAKLMRKYDHPNVVKLYGVAVEKEPLMLVMELVNGGALDSYLQKNAATMKQQDKIDMVAGAAYGLTYLHSKRCIHRDVAARNCLFDPTKNIVKISDFGLSQEGETYQMTTAKRLPIKWLSPETLTTGIYSAKSDVFSYGVMVWEIFSNGQEPYIGMNNAEVQGKVLEGYRMEMAPDAPEQVAELVVKHCWDANPDTRYTMAKVVRELESSTGCKPPERLNRKRGSNDQTFTEGTVDQTVATTEERTVDKTVDKDATVEKTVDEDKKQDKDKKKDKDKKESAKPKAKASAKDKKPRVSNSRKKSVPASRKKKTRGG